MSSLGLRRGDFVEIRSAGEILRTLDVGGRLEGLPFMPEMLPMLGSRFRVAARADKVCDTIKYTGSRRLADSVILDAPRCNGSAHDGCQAECRVFWKEAWLKRVPEGAPAAAAGTAESDLLQLQELVGRLANSDVYVDGAQQKRWMCQNTELYVATERLNTFDPRPYINCYLNGNVELGRCLKVSARAAIEEPLRALGLTKPFQLKGTATGPVSEELNLQPGEWVEVRSLDEITATLTPDGRNSGLWFDREMAPYCGRRFQVRQRVTRFIDEFKFPGKLVKLSRNPVVTLEGVICSGDLSLRRWMCPREITSYWRECWLRRVEGP
jgi:hypothetical protein